MQRKPVAVQLELPTPAAHRAGVEWKQRILPLVRELAAAHGRKEVAFDLDVGHSYVDSVLIESGNYRLKAEELVYFLLADESGRLLSLIAELCGFELAEQQPLTADEKLTRLEQRLRSKLGELGEQTIREAYERGTR